MGSGGAFSNDGFRGRPREARHFRLDNPEDILLI
jgi:hypothetical protein